MINVAIDLHGTYNSNVDLFNSIINKWSNKINFIILSGSPVDDIVRELFECNDISFVTNTTFPIERACHHCKTRFNLNILSMVDFCRYDQKLPMELKINSRTGKESWYYTGDESVWWALKSIMCNIYKIDLLIDDKEQYKKYFGNTHPTSFFLWNKYKWPTQKRQQLMIDQAIHRTFLRKRGHKYI